MCSEGIELNSTEDHPKDPYMESRRQPKHTYTTPSDFDKLCQFLEMDRKVLKFYCLWDDRDSMFGEMRPYVSLIVGKDLCHLTVMIELFGEMRPFVSYL